MAIVATEKEKVSGTERERSRWLQSVSRWLLPVMVLLLALVVLMLYTSLGRGADAGGAACVQGGKCGARGQVGGVDR
eukprot:3087363-Prymnesium_polylepis.1